MEERREMKEVRRKKEEREEGRKEGGDGGRKTKRKKDKEEERKKGARKGANRIVVSFQEWSQYGLGTRLSMYTTTSLTARVDELVSNLS